MPGLLSPAPKGWKPSSPPPPPPPSPPPAAAFRRTPHKGAVRTYKRPSTPGLLDASVEDVRPSVQYFQNAVAIKMQQRKEIKQLKDEYVSPVKVDTYRPEKSAFELDDVHLKTLQTIFTLLDSDQDKLLDEDQLRTAIIAMGIPPTQRLILEILRNVPSWAGKGVDFNTFKTVITDRLKSNPVHMTDIDELFKVFESDDGKGYISAKHLTQVLMTKTTNNTDLKRQEVEEIFKELDIKQNNKQIDYHKFLADISSGFVNFE